MMYTARVTRQISAIAKTKGGKGQAAITMKTLQSDAMHHSCKGTRFASVVEQMLTRAELKFFAVARGEQFALMTGE